MHMTEIGHGFDTEHAKDINHGGFKEERLVKETLNSGPQTVNRCALLPIQYQPIQIRMNIKEDRDRPHNDQASRNQECAKGHG